MAALIVEERSFFMAVDKQTILTSVNANVNGTATAPEGAELALWGNYLEKANQEWANAGDLQVLIKPLQATMLQSGTSVALPGDFKEKFAGYVSIESALWAEYSQQNSTRSTGDYVTWGGNQQDGYYLKASRALYSTSAVTGRYHSRPTSMPTLTSVSPIPDPEFLEARVSEKALRQRGQPEYQDFQDRADLLLQRMVANDVSADIGRDNTIRTQMQSENFTLGED